ncbi:hypothetical protein HPB51_027849 [Rhipicephalus microplus]|uniref:M13 family peptidase n=1 Tax=Rhipicephalus microplus TaxID=6941 RepID=A0A9J6CYR9_RHIMP|nr:hypothetical protein HPB51_027849 [Rhipicephalus microplus]
MDKKSDDKQTQKPRAPGKKKSEDNGGAKSPENTALPKPSVEVAQNASPAKLQRRSQDSKSPTRSPVAPESKEASPIVSGAASPDFGGRQAREQGPKSSTRSPTASQVVSMVASGAASTDTTGRQVKGGSRKQRSLSPKHQASAVVSSPDSPTRVTPSKLSGRDHKGKKGSASGSSQSPLAKSAACSVSLVPVGSKDTPASATAPTSSTSKTSPPGGSQAASEKEERAAGASPSLTVAENKQKVIDSSMVELPTLTRNAKWNEIIISTFVCLGVILVVATTSLIIYMTSRHFQYVLPLCRTEDCRKHAKLLTGNIDWAIDPCEDFASYVCSAARDFASRGGTQVTSVMDAFQSSWYGKFWDMLRRGVDKVPVGKKALAMYEKCLSYSTDVPHPKVFIDFLGHQNLSWPEPPEQVPSPLDYILSLTCTWQIPLWIAVSVHHSPDKTNHRVLLEPGMYIPVMYHQHKRATASYAYTRYWNEYVNRLYPDQASRPPLNETVVDRIRNIEWDVLERLYSVFASKAPKPAVLPFSDISNYVVNASAHTWVASFQNFLLLQPELGLDDNIMVSDVNLLGAIGDIFSKYDEKDLYIHLTWLLVQYYAPVIDYRLLIDFNGGADKAAAYLPNFCSFHVEATYKAAVLAIGLASRFTAQDRKTIDDGFDGLVSAAIDKVVESNWIDAESRERLVHKLTATQKALWPPDALLQAGMLDRIYFAFPGQDVTLAHYWTDTRMAVLRMNKTDEYERASRLPWNTLPGYVSYSYVTNVLNIAMAVIAEPAYYPHGTMAMLHGGVLFLFAAQLVKAMDAQGLRWTANGTLVDSLVTDSTKREFLERNSCLSDVDKSIFPEIPATAIAYTALKKAHVRNRSEPLALSDNLPYDKVFFMTLCFLSCKSTGRWDPLGLDCNKVAQNSPVFAKAFNCPVGSRMNPAKKCSFI